MEPEDWKREWGVDNLVFASEHCDLLPRIAREFLISHGLPRRIIYENPLEGDWEEYVSAEISFELLFKPLVLYDTLINWGDFDETWSQQIVIGEEEFCNGSAAYCIHQSYETVTRIDVESMEPETFVNSSLPQFGGSLLLAVRWSKAIQQGAMENWKASLYNLADTIESLDAEAFQHRNSEWPRLINYALDNEPGFLDITADPKRSRPRF